MQCSLAGGQDKAQVPLLLLDLIDLEARQPGAPGSADAEENRAPFLLLPDPAVPHRCLSGVPKLAGLSA